MATEPIRIELFKGIVPKVNPRLLDGNHAQTAKNCDIRSGKLTPYTVPTQAAATSRTIYDASDVIAKPSQLSPEDPEYVLDPSTITCKWYGGSSFGEVSCTYKGSTVTDKGLVLRYWFPGKSAAFLGGLNTPTYRLTFNNGKATVNTPSAVGGDIISGDRMPLYLPGATPEYSYGELQVVGIKAIDFRYIILTPTYTYYREHEVLITCDMRYLNPVAQYCSYSFVTANENDAESPASDPSEPKLRRPGQSLTISVPGKGKLYRSSRVKGGTFQLLAEFDEADDYVDMVPDSVLGELLPDRLIFEEDSSPVTKSVPDSTTEWTKVVKINSFFASFNSKILYFSEPEYEYLWPNEYRIEFDETIIGIVDVGSSLLVITDGDPYWVHFTGHPKYATAFRIVQNGQQGCLGKNTIFRVNNVVGYISSRGVVLVNGTRADVASDGHYTPEQWGTLVGATPSCFVYDQFLIITPTSGDKLIFAFDGGKLGELVTSDGGAAITWKSKEFTYGHPVEFNHLRVNADSYDITLTVYADGELSQTRVIKVTEQNATFAIEKKRPSKRWSVQLVFNGGAGECVHELSMSTSVEQLK